ncbi:MAG: hypothetical protein GXO25_01010 [Euryarchaeota archaeon]|nr:hypothetical protein [Euryarchaeota archaeon]
MEHELEMLMSFVVKDTPDILITGCALRDSLGLANAKCTATDCEKVDDCVALNPAMPFLPLRRFDVWVVDFSEFKMSIGYVFELASQTLRDMGVLAIFNTAPDDNIAISYGFQPLHHGAWHYYLKG